MTVAIGLDLGLDALRVAALVDDRVELIATVPAVVGYAGGRALVGDAAAALPPGDRLDDLTTWLGRRAPGPDGDPGVAGVAWPMVAGVRRAPAELIAWLFRAGVHAVEARHGRAAGAVIAVPVDLGAIERRVLRDAALIAGLPVVRLIAAPAVAALAISDGQPARVLIVDAGASSLRAGLVEHGNGAMDLLGHAEAIGAGGRAIDRAIAAQLAVEAGRDPDELRDVARRWKEGRPIAGALRRTPRPDELGLWTTPSVRELDAACQAALAAGAVDLAGVSHAILIGGGAALPTIATRFHHVVGALARAVDDPASVIARGAARAAQMFVDEPAAVIVDAIPSSFALGAGSAMASMVPVGAIAPTREVRLIARDRPDRTAVEVELWEELPSPRPYGRYQIAGLPPGAGAIAACELTVDVDRIPRIDASDLVNGAALTVTPLLEVGLGAEAVAALRAELRGVDAVIRAAAAALALAACTTAARPPAVVELAPHGELVDLEAAVVAGYVTVIDFHAAWCARCVVVDAQLRAAAARDPGIVIRRVDIGDGNTPVARAYRIRTLPHVLVVDRGGVLRARLVGEDALTAGRRALELASEPR